MLIPVEKCFSESTIHSLAHFTGERRLYVKLIWLAALIVSFSFCCMRISDAFTKFLSREVSTTVKEGSVNFEFPDLYICNESPISGSYSVSLGDPNAQLLNQNRRMVNETVVRYIPAGERMEEFAVRLINTLPYQFLSDYMGHQTWQSIIELNINDVDSRRKVVIHHSNIYLNCFRLNLTDADRTNLNGPASRMQITLFADTQVPAPVDNSTQRDVFEGYAGTTNLKPSDWDFNYGYDYARTSGFRIFFTPRGLLPNDWTAQIVLGGGQRIELELAMEDAIMKAEDFAGQCVDIDRTEGVDYANPYTGEKETFGYGQYACLHREIAQMSKAALNCSILRHPMPWEFRDVPSCFNMTAVLNQSTPMSSFESLRKKIANSAIKNCRGKIPCGQRFYSFKHFTTNWPSQRVYDEYLLGYIKYKLVDYPATSNKKHLPGIQNLAYYASSSQAREMLMQISLSAADEKCSETHLAISYTFNSLIADVGGLLGLFLGMSLLSALELVELIHDCVFAAYHSYKARHQTDPERQLGEGEPKELDSVVANIGTSQILKISDAEH